MKNLAKTLITEIVSRIRGFVFFRSDKNGIRVTGGMQLDDGRSTLQTTPKKRVRSRTNTKRK